MHTRKPNVTRIDLLGVKKDDLPLVWHDLDKAGFVSGHACAKGLRTVNTCGWSPATPVARTARWISSPRGDVTAEPRQPA